MKRSNKGFSIIEVMIGFGLLGLFSYFMMQTFTNQQKSTKTIESKIEMNDLMSRLQSYFLDSEICKDTFGGLVIAEGQELDITQIKKGTEILFTNQSGQNTFGNMTLQTMKIQRKNGLYNRELDFNLGFIKTNSDQTYGGANLQRTIVISAQFDPAVPNRIIGCYSALDSAIETARELACKDICPTCWDEVNKKCVITGTPIYKDQLDGSVKLEPTPIYKTQNFKCSQCKDECNACPGGWAETSRSCSLGKNCGFNRWRNCTSSCRGATGSYSAPVGFLIPAPTP